MIDSLRHGFILLTVDSRYNEMFENGESYIEYRNSHLKRSVGKHLKTKINIEFYMVY